MYSSQKNVAIYYRTFYCLVINKSFKFNVMMTERFLSTALFSIEPLEGKRYISSRPRDPISFSRSTTVQERGYSPNDEALSLYS